MSENDMLVAIIRWIAMLRVGDSAVRVLYDLSEKIRDPEMFRQLKKCLRRESCWVDQVAQTILELAGTVVVPGTTGQFVAKEKFVCDTGRNAKVKISSLGNNFTGWFLSGASKIEDIISEQTLRYHKLRKASVDSPIITELGGEAKAGTTLSEMFSLMEKQKNGENGVLLNNGYANIFYIRDIAGVLRTVYVRWRVGGWDVAAFSAGRPFGWFVGSQVFSRDPDFQSTEPLAQAA